MTQLVYPCHTPPQAGTRKQKRSHILKHIYGVQSVNFHHPSVSIPWHYPRYQPKHLNKFTVLFSAKGFGEAIGHHVLSRNMLDLECLFPDLLNNPFVSDVDTTCASFVVGIQDVNPGISAIRI